MKKILIIIFGLLSFLLVDAATAATVSISATPKAAIVGEKVNIAFKVNDMPADVSKIDLYIDTSLKKTYSPVTTPGFQYTFTWDTKAAASTAGTHGIIVKLLRSDGYVINLGSMPYVVTASGSGTTEKSPEVGPTSTAVGGFDLGQLGTVNFLPTKVNNANELIVAIIKWLMGILGALAVVAIVYSGIMYITAGSDQAKSESAKKNLVWAIIGVIIIAVSFFIVELIAKVVSGKL